MRSTDMVFLRVIGNIDGDLIEGAAPENKAVRACAAAARRRWPRPLAACLLIAAAIALPPVLDALRGGPPAEIDLPAGICTLHFNQAHDKPADSCRVNLPMMFGQGLTADEIEAIFPDLGKARTITAMANFFYHDSSLYDIEGRISSAAGLTTAVQIAKDKVVLDYGLGEDAQTSDVMGISVTAACSEDEKEIICFAEFQIGGLCYHAVLSGDAALKDSLRRKFTEVIGLLVSGGAADISVLNPSRPEGWRVNALTLEEARDDAAFGRFIPPSIPGPPDFRRSNRKLRSGALPHPLGRLCSRRDAGHSRKPGIPY